MANFFTYEDRLKIKEQMFFTEIGEKLVKSFKKGKVMSI